MPYCQFWLANYRRPNSKGLIIYKKTFGSGGKVHHPKILGSGLGLGLGLGGLGGELRVRVMVRARVRISKSGGELLHQR